jgi:hypothetical protein
MLILVLVVDTFRINTSPLVWFRLTAFLSCVRVVLRLCGGVNFYTQTKTVTASWKENDERAGSSVPVAMPTSQQV